MHDALRSLCTVLSCDTNTQPLTDYSRPLSPLTSSRFDVLAASSRAVSGPSWSVDTLLFPTPHEDGQAEAEAAADVCASTCCVCLAFFFPLLVVFVFVSVADVAVAKAGAGKADNRNRAHTHTHTASVRSRGLDTDRLERVRRRRRLVGPLGLSLSAFSIARQGPERKRRRERKSTPGYICIYINIWQVIE